MITGNDVSKSFDGLKALDHMDFCINDGSIYGLVGPNGCGKSTLIRHIMGVFKPDGGEILIDNEVVFDNPVVKERIGYVPDDIYYFPSATIMDMARYYAGIYSKFDMGRLKKIIGGFNELNEDLMFRKMSKGMQKQASVALALSTGADILILDEPMDGLDPVIRKQVWNLILDRVSKEGLTVLVSSHNLRELEDVCDHVGVMNHGKILLERSLDELQDNICKVRLAYDDEKEENIANKTFDSGGRGDSLIWPDDLDILKSSISGRIHTLIIRGDREDIEDKLNENHPILLDFVPLSLEEIFIYELGGADYEVKNIIL